MARRKQSHSKSPNKTINDNGVLHRGHHAAEDTQTKLPSLPRKKSSKVKTIGINAMADALPQNFLVFCAIALVSCWLGASVLRSSALSDGHNASIPFQQPQSNSPQNLQEIKKQFVNTPKPKPKPRTVMSESQNTSSTNTIISTAVGASNSDIFNQCNFDTSDLDATSSSMVISIVARNMAHRAEPFFRFLRNQDYGAKRICLLIQTSNNQDNTEFMLKNWVDKYQSSFAGVVFRSVPTPRLLISETQQATREDDDGRGWMTSTSCAFKPHCWTSERLLHVSQLRQNALDFAKDSGARYFFSLDSDVLLSNPGAISQLVSQHRPIVAPLLYAYPNTWDANVWESTHPNGGYVRGKYQLSFRANKFTGCIRVKASHSVFLVDLNAAGVDKLLLHDDTEQMSDINIMSTSAVSASVPMFGCNDNDYGYTMSVAGMNTEYTHHAEVLAFSQLLNIRGLHAAVGPKGPSASRVKKSVVDNTNAVPAIPDEEIFKSSCNNKDLNTAQHEATTLRDQLEELRKTMVTQLDRVQDITGASACNWDGDCSKEAFYVEHRSNLPLSEFHEKYAMKRRPVVITDYVNQGKLSNKGEVFNESYWRRMCGHKTVRIQQATKSANWGGLSYHSDTTLNNAFEVLRTTKDPLVYGVFDTPLPRACPEVLNDFVMPKYFANDYMQLVSHDLQLEYRDSWPSFFLGKANTTANLHVDMFGSSFWMAVFQGRKHWRFVDESQRGLLYENRPTNDFPDVDLFNPDYEKFPLLRHVRTFDVILEPGDLIFVPGGSPHQVRNLDETITLAGNYVDEGSFETMREECDHKNRKGYARYKQLLTSINHPDFPRKMDLDLGDLSWNELKARATWKPPSRI
eukprot:m.68239 g.68239  ORF g.68239 m.68239 type:complete len:857 (+) comp23935_c0_seq1:207-2777(+)